MSIATWTRQRSKAENLAAVALLSFVGWTSVAGHPQAGNAASSPGLLQQCLSAALVRPKIAHPLRMIHAGIWPNTGFRFQQAVVGAFAYGAMPAECAARYTRVALGNVQMLKKGRWVTTCRPCGGGTNEQQATIAKVSTYGGHPNDPNSKYVYNTCSRRKFHKVSIRMVIRLTRPALGTSEGARAWRFRTVVHGNCADAALSAKRNEKIQDEFTE
jgi:hypothetical protein